MLKVSIRFDLMIPNAKIWWSFPKNLIIPRPLVVGSHPSYCCHLDTPYHVAKVQIDLDQQNQAIGVTTKKKRKEKIT